jgi:sideroflexin-5
MSCFVLSNLVVTAGMLTPGLGTRGTVFWQIANQSLNVAINTSNANKSHPLSTRQLATSYALAVSASCSVAVGLNSLVPRLTSLSAGLRTALGRLVPFAAVASAGVLNVFLMRAEEIRSGIDVFPVTPQLSSTSSTSSGGSYDTADAKVLPIGTSRRAALIAVSETALSRVINATPIMVLPPLLLLRLQRQRWLATIPRLVLPVNLGLILATSLMALPCALGVFPARQRVPSRWLEDEFRDVEWLEFNRGL